MSRSFDYRTFNVFLVIAGDPSGVRLYNAVNYAPKLSKDRGSY